MFVSPPSCGAVAVGRNTAVFSLLGGNAPPVNTVAPVISSNGDLANPVVGDVFNTTDGTFSPVVDPHSFDYQWYRSGSAIGPATSNQYTAATADIGSTISSSTVINAANGTSAAAFSSNTSGTVTAPPSAGWWTSGGATGVIAAWQPKGAATQSDSKINLANPGTHDATDIVAPAWDAANGWKFNGLTQVVDSTIIPGTGVFWIVQFTNSAGAGSIIGYFNGGNERVELSESGASWVTGNGQASIWGTHVPAANIAMVEGGSTYLNGTASSSSGPWSGTESQTVLIGARRRADLLSIDNFESVDITALAAYNPAPNPTQITAIAAAMAAL